MRQPTRETPLREMANVILGENTEMHDILATKEEVRKFAEDIKSATEKPFDEFDEMHCRALAIAQTHFVR